MQTDLSKDETRLIFLHELMEETDSDYWQSTCSSLIRWYLRNQSWTLKQEALIDKMIEQSGE